MTEPAQEPAHEPARQETTTATEAASVPEGYAPWSGHVPADGRRTPVTTYRLQMGSTLTFDDARRLVPYLRDLGVTDVYLSPVLAAAPGSTHGYDVVDHTRISEVMGGRAGLERLADDVHATGMGLVLDIVPNHMAVPTPAWHNLPLWSVLRNGPGSPFASWFDVPVDAPILMPVLGARIGKVLADEQLVLERMVVPTEPERGEQWVLRYFDHVFPVAEGTQSLPMHVLVGRQHYRLAYWKVGDAETNYRRFFDVGTLAAIRVEDPEVFAGSTSSSSTCCAGGRWTPCGSTTPTAWRTPPATSTTCPRRRAGPGSPPRRSSPPTSPCRWAGTWPARRGTTPPGASTSSRSTRAAPSGWAPSCTS